MSAIRNVLVGVSIAFSAGTASAQNLGFMRDSPLSFMTQDDTRLLVSNYTQALDSLPDGHTNTWNNPKTGHSGTATPLKSMKQGGMNCRLLEITNNAGGQSGRSEFTFCKTKDGWKTSGR